jgi:DNA helicase-2/ATP-dependent DNA helicase PcrA
VSLNLKQLNTNQLAAVKHTGGPALVLAGAGSGKTGVITCRTAHLIECGVGAREILVLTFTNKAAAEMRNRVSSLLSKARIQGLVMSTFHAFGALLLRQYGDRLGYRNSFSILDTSDQKRVLQSALEALRLSKTGLRLEEIQYWISLAKRNQTHPAQLSEAKYSPVLPYAERLFEQYQLELKGMQAVDFDDLILLPIKLIEQHEEVRKQVRNRFKFVMVDEYQDTSLVQLKLLKGLVGSDNIMAVGDDDQSIYSFRGAAPSNINEFESHFPGTKIITLDQNYRSTETILKAANQVISENKHRRPKSLWSQRGKGEQIRHISCGDACEEASFVAEEISHLIENGMQPRQFAVLYRVNPQASWFEESFIQRSLSYHVVGGTSLFDRTEIRDWIAYLEVLINPYNELSLRRILNVPRRGIGSAAIKHLDEASNRAGSSLLRTLERVDSLSLSNKAKEGCKALLDLLNSWRGKFQSSPACELVQSAKDYVDAVGLAGFYKQTEKNPVIANRRIESIYNMIDRMARVNRDESMYQYLSRLKLDNREIEEEGGKRNAVTFMTLHGAKGLEYPHVYLVGFEKDYLPHRRSMETAGGLAEERRLCYVGMTRAMDRLTLTSARTRTRRNERIPRQPSPFLDEIPEEILVCEDRDSAAVDDRRTRNLEYIQMIKEIVSGEDS